MNAAQEEVFQRIEGRHTGANYKVPGKKKSSQSTRRNKSIQTEVQYTEETKPKMSS